MGSAHIKTLILDVLNVPYRNPYGVANVTDNEYKCEQIIKMSTNSTYIPLQFHSVLMMATGSHMEHTKDLREREWIHAQTCLMIPVGLLWFHLSLFLPLSHHCLHITSANQTRGLLTWRTHNLRVTVPVPSQWALNRICSITPDSYHSATPTPGEGGGEAKNDLRAKMSSFIRSINCGVVCSLPAHLLEVWFAQPDRGERGVSKVACLR